MSISSLNSGHSLLARRTINEPLTPPFVARSSPVCLQVLDRLRVLLPPDHSALREAAALIEEWSKIVQENDGRW